MERATHIDENGWYINGVNAQVVFHTGIEENRIRGKDIDRLAAYEDTGLEPDKIAETIWRLQDYFDADREGRLIVLPCEDRIDRENLANRIERMVVRDDYSSGVSSGEKKLAYAITSALRSEE